VEPKRSMSAFAACVVVALALLCLAGFAVAAEWSAIGLLVVATYLWSERTRLLANGRRDGRNSPQHRRALDRIVLAQWLGAGILSFLVALAARHYSLDPFSGGGRLLRALIVGFAVGILGVFVSSLVDWTVILPKVSGLSGPAPCECAVGERWRYTTDVWYLHRAAATAVVYLVVIGIPAFMAAESSGSGQIAWGVLTTGVILVAGFFFRDMFLAGRYALNPPVLVGDLIWVEAPPEGDEDLPMLHRRAYVLDVSLQGAKYKALTDGRYRGARFTQKSDGTVSNEDLGGAKKAPSKEGEPALCPPGHCSGVNWYCRHNPKAHD
jgi:hypothetical protein